MTTFLYVLLAVLAFGVMILIHEAGHFFAARACGVRIYEFALGMGPRIFGWHGKDGTDYNLRLFPIGGFVSMKGEDEDADGEDSFSQKSALKRFLIVAAGAIMNIILGIIVTFVLVLTSTLGSTVVAEFDKNAVSSEWLFAGDKILSVDGSSVHTATELSYEIMHDAYEPVEVVVLRGGEKIVIEDVVFPTKSASGMLFGSPDFRVYAEEKTVISVAKHTFF
ncbi:MAG: site-2 protease family protein, partial [Clostridia bacterium]|nr:site-2 protease family protein [Clostridia bacterium]